MPVAGSTKSKPRYVKVIKTDEKGSDVNIAAHLISDGYKGIYQVAVILTNDSDLVEPVRIVHNELKLPVGILNPRPASPSHELREYTTFVKPIRKGVLAASQFPRVLTDTTGSFHKPKKW